MPPIIRVLGASGSGKTTLVERLVPALADRGLKVGTIKHASHGFSADEPGTDSARHAAAGADPVVVIDDRHTMLVSASGHHRRTPETLAGICQRWHTGVDLVLVEGFTDAPGPAILVHRSGLERRPVSEDTVILCTVTDEPLGAPMELDPAAEGTVAAVADMVMGVMDLAATPRAPAVTLVVGNRRIDLNPFVASFLEATVRGAISALRGVPPGRPAIELRIGGQR
jgi:molybdopterin-guanine dinucleotide biosynthesis adapter protein